MNKLLDKVKKALANNRSNKKSVTFKYGDKVYGASRNADGKVVVVPLCELGYSLPMTQQLVDEAKERAAKKMGVSVKEVSFETEATNER